MDFDASFVMMGQPMAGLAATVFALAEPFHASGKQLLEAYVAGFEVTAKLAWSMPKSWSEGGAFWRVRTPRLSLEVNGAGDAIAALFLVHYARSRSAATALGEAAASVYGLLRRTAAAGSREILLVAAQDELVSPTQRFAVERV